MPITIFRFKRKISIKAKLVMGLLLSACLVEQAFAVFAYTDMVTTPRRLTLQVGSSQFGTINSVTFNVTGDKMVSNQPTIEGSPSNTVWTQPASPANGILFVVTSQIPFTLSNTQQAVKFNATSPVGLTCISGSGCGSTVIPFSKISWISNNRDSSGLDIKDGAFTGGTTPNLFWTWTTNAGLRIENTLTFTYANDTLYPAGQYTGRVTYTASLP